MASLPNHLLNGELCRWGPPDPEWTLDEQLRLWEEDYQQLTQALNRAKDRDRKTKYRPLSGLLDRAQYSERDLTFQDKDENGRRIGGPKQVRYAAIMLGDRAAKYWSEDEDVLATPHPSQEEWAMHICKPDLLPHFAQGEWHSGREYNEIFIFEVTKPGEEIDPDPSKEERPYTSDKFVSDPGRLQEVLDDCAIKCLGYQDHGEVLPFHNIPKAVLIVAHRPRVFPRDQDREHLNVIDKGSKEQWPKRHLRNGDWNNKYGSKQPPRVRPIAVLLAVPTAEQRRLALALRAQIRRDYPPETLALMQYCLGLQPYAIHGSNQWDGFWLERRREPLAAIQQSLRDEVESIVECLRLLWLSGMQNRSSWNRKKYPAVNFGPNRFGPIPQRFRDWLEEYARHNPEAIDRDSLGDFLAAVSGPARRTAAGSTGPRQPDFPDVQEISDEEEGPALRPTREDNISQAKEALEAAIEAKSQEIDALRRKKREIQRAPAQDLEKLLKDLVAGPNEEEMPDPAKEQKRQVTGRRQALAKESEALKTKIAEEEARLEALEAERARARQVFLGENEERTETQQDGEDVWEQPPEENTLWLRDEDEI
jgi:hypothetical protein